MKKVIILILALVSIISTGGCSEDEFYTFNLDKMENKTYISFKVVDQNNNPVKNAYVVSFRSLPPLHIRTGEGFTNDDGIFGIEDITNTTEGYANIVAPGYNSKKVALSLKKEEENEIIVKLEDQNVIKLLSYNMQEGFRGSEDLKKEFATWVKTYDPDIIIFQEMMKFTEATFATLAKSYGHEYSVLTKTTGIPTGITSKEPIEDIKRVVVPAQLHHGYVYGKTFGIDVYAIHLCPYELTNPANKYGIDRYDEMKIILNDASQINSDNSVLIAGDFNSHNQFDSDSYGPGFNYADRDHRVTDVCKEKGFFDAYPLLNAEFKGSWPTDHISVNGTNKGARIDYIMINNTLKGKCVYSDIIQAKFNDKASDHYPNYIEIKK